MFSIDLACFCIKLPAKKSILRKKKSISVLKKREMLVIMIIEQNKNGLFYTNFIKKQIFHLSLLHNDKII